MKELVKKEGWGKCPKCQRIGEKKEGCNYMYCLCKQHYCYLCGAMLTEAEHFSHFQNVPG